ncbi:hypothetical protein BH10PSE6_BH10PSE6_57870 [soil metagenome]
MYWLNGNPSSTPSRRIRPARLLGHRRGDATFIAIAALLAIFFVTQAGWVIAQQGHPETGVSRR